MSDVILFSCRHVWHCFELCRRLQDFRISFKMKYSDDVVGSEVNGGNAVTVSVDDSDARKASVISDLLRYLPEHVMEAEAADSDD
jgi:hypothetical protein